ncbi:Protein SAWADEE HOMEODOMAIN -like protein 2 [Bienertia sinuspersici]
MADDTIAESYEVELEAKRESDGSWHPCQVSLCSGGGLSVKFEGQSLEDMILDVKDAFVYLRVRSIPLQGEDCCYIEEGKHVLAACENNSQKLFFDAVVEKAIRVRHSKRASCRCTFMIKWLSDDDEKGISSIPSTSIMKLATESINAHPVVAAFLNPLDRSYLSTSSASFTVFDDTENEIDFHALFKQIEGIGSLTDSSQKELLNDTLLKVNQDGRTDQNKPTSLEQVSKCVKVSCGRSHLRRSARRQNTSEVSEPTIEPSAPSPSEKSVQNQSPLSPLASRAVLASLVSKIPQKAESVLFKERKCASVSDFPPSLQCSEGYGGSLSFSMQDEESTLSMVTSRLTRSAMNKESSNAHQNVDPTSVEDATSFRVARSVAHKGKGISADKPSQDLLQDNVRSTSSTRSVLTKGMEVPDVEIKSRATDEDAKYTILSSSTARLTRSTARAGTRLLDDRTKDRLQAKPEIESSQLHYNNSGYDPYEALKSIKKRTVPHNNAELRSAENFKKQKDMNAVDRRQKKKGDMHAAAYLHNLC